MNTYTIITTILVLTQIIRVTQNHISLRRQNMLFDKEVGELKDVEVKKEDFENQKKFYRLAVEKLEMERIREIGEWKQIKE